MLPPINPESVIFWLYICIVLVLFLCFSLFTEDTSGTNNYTVSKILGSGLGVVISIMLIFALSSCALFRADSFAKLIDGNIVQKEISEYTPTINEVPLMDKDTAELLANRQMGSLVDEVSQYDLASSVQINYQNKPIRVLPLKYSGFFKWVNNKSVGIPSYITVDMSTQKTEIHRLEQGIRYSPSGYFGEDLNRYVYFKYPTALLGDPVFEIDDNGNPYWVIPKMDHRVGMFGGTDVKGIIVVDAINGEITEYTTDDVPEYIDNVYPTNVLIELYDYYGKYKNGFMNSLFGQKGVIQTTEGYNYIPQNNDIWVYTGVTSVVNDESNVGFIYMNKRTKEIQYYEIAGAEEYSAMASAEGAVQHLSYTSTFPLLLQIDGRPTYCVALKDAGGLVKMYGLVDMAQYQIVVVENTMENCLEKYCVNTKENEPEIEVEKENLNGVVEDIRTANIDGTTYIYVRISENPTYYAFSVKENEEIVLLNIEDSINFAIAKGEKGKIIPAILNK